MTGLVLGGRLLRPRWQPRLVALMAGLAIATSLVAGRLTQLTTLDAPSLHALAVANQVRRVPIEAERGVVFDRHGKPLVINQPDWAVEIVAADLPARPRDRARELQAVARLAGVGDASLAEAARRAELDPFRPVLLRRGLDGITAQLLSQQLPQLPGIQLDERPVRAYFDPAAFAHVLGYTGQVSPADMNRGGELHYLPDEQVGRAGIEAGLEPLLRGQDGEKVVAVDALGRPARELSVAAAQPGRNVYLSLDAGLQVYVDGVLRDEMRRAQSSAGAAIVVDTHDGELLALASEPGYDDNLFTHGLTSSQYAQLAGDPTHPLFDVATAGTYPPGSTFKMITAAAALQEGAINGSTQLDCPAAIHDGAWTYHNWAGGDMGSMTVTKALAVSCDTFFYAVARMLGDRTLQRYAKAFGYGSVPGLELPQQAPGVAPDRDWKTANCQVLFAGRDCQWYPGDTLTMGIGQSFLLTTPLIQAMYVTALANGGSLLQPTLVHEVRTQDGRLLARATPVVRSRLPVSPANLAFVREGMRECLDAPYGTGFLFRAAHFLQGGGCKTGTAQFGSGNQMHAWFVFFSPFDNPEIAVVVFVQGGGEGHQVAEPVALDIARYYFAHRAEIRG